MARATRITKIKFHSINRDIKAEIQNGTYDSSLIAAQQHVSTETVRAVRRAKTWPGFITAKQLKTTNDQRRKADAFDKQDAVAQTKLGKSLKRLAKNPVQYVTTKQFTDAIDSLNGKIRHGQIRADTQKIILDKHEEKLSVHGMILIKIKQLKPRWFQTK